MTTEARCKMWKRQYETQLVLNIELYQTFCLLFKLSVSLLVGWEEENFAKSVNFSYPCLEAFNHDKKLILF